MISPLGRLAVRATTSAILFLSFDVIVVADNYPRQPFVDVQDYVFKIELRDDTNVISGEARVEFLFNQDGVTEVFLDLTGKSADGKTGMTVSSVRSGDQPVAFKHENNRLQLSFASPARRGERRRVTVVYSGVPADGLIIGTNRKGERVFFGDNFPDRCRHWLPTIDHPYDKSPCEFDITAPEAYQVVAPGAMIESTTLPGERRLTRYRESVPITTYCMVIGVARFAVATIGQVACAPVQSWVYASEHDAGFADYAIAMKPLEFFSWRVGPFPYEKLANVQSKTRWGGMENASTIFYSERSVTGQGRNEALFAHEIAHQWFGDSVTESDWDHTWLSEGFATYFAHVYNEYMYGRDVMNRGLRRDRETVIRYFEKNPGSAIVTPADDKLANILSANSYQKGSWFLHMLRREVGDEAFWKGISGYFVKYRNGNALTGDFEAAMNEASGKQLDAFFQQWVYTPGQPVIRGAWWYGGGALNLEIHQIQTSAVTYKAPLDIGIVLDRNTAPTVNTIRLEQRDQTFAIKLDREPIDVVLDPNVWLLMQQGEFVKKHRD